MFTALRSVRLMTSSIGSGSDTGFGRHFILPGRLPTSCFVRSYLCGPAVLLTHTSDSTGAGQGCIVSERFIVQKEIYESFVNLMELRVRTLRSGRDVGAMINGIRLAHLEKLVGEAVQQGARLLVGGKSCRHPDHPQAHFFSPTLLCDVRSDMEIAQQECFAPIMLVMRAEVSLRSSISPASFLKFVTELE